MLPTPAGRLAARRAVLLACSGATGQHTSILLRYDIIGAIFQCANLVIHEIVTWQSICCALTQLLADLGVALKTHDHSFRAVMFRQRGD